MPPDSADRDRADLDEAAGGEVGGTPDYASGGPPHEVPDEDEPATRRAGNGATTDWEDRARRAAADADNLRKRHTREMQRVGELERAEVAAGWLPVIDNLELALEHADADPASIVEGIRAVLDQAIAVMARLGYERRADLGVPFDASRHEVVSVVDEPESEPGTVVRVVRPGYGDAQRQLRPVAVAVSRKPE
jgi:molecular chaperone GrpE